MANSEKDAIDAIQDLCRTHNFIGLDEFEAALDASLCGRVMVAFTLARARCVQGDFKKASATVAKVDLIECSKDDRLLLNTQGAFIRAMQDCKFVEGHAKVCTALRENSSCNEAAVSLASVFAFHLQFCAFACHEPIKEKALLETRILEQSADTLLKQGYIDEGLAASALLANSLKGEARINYLESLLNLAEQYHSPSFKAQNQVSLVQELIKQKRPPSILEEALSKVEEYYSNIDDLVGREEINAINFEYQRFLGTPSTKEIAKVYSKFKDAKYWRRATSVLLILAEETLREGDIDASLAYRKECFAISTETKLGLLAENAQLGIVDLLIRYGNYSQAIALAESVLAKGTSPFMSSCYESLLGICYQVLQDRDRSSFYLETAFQGFQDLGLQDTASIVVAPLMSFSIWSSRENDHKVAESTLQRNLSDDISRSDWVRAIEKLDSLAYLQVHRFRLLPLSKKDSSLLLLAKKYSLRAENILNEKEIKASDKCLLYGNILQSRALLECQTGNMQEVENLMKNALNLYERNGLAYQCANAHQTLGILKLNLANKDLLVHFGSAESHFKRAQELYRSTGMERQFADASFMLAKLYTNAAVHVGGELAKQLTSAAVALLSEGANALDTLRRAYTARSKRDMIYGKRSLVSNSVRIYDLLLQIQLQHRHNADQAWDTVQNCKSRCLSDVMSSGNVVPSSIKAFQTKDLNVRVLIEKEASLTQKLLHGTPEERFSARMELSEIHNQMKSKPDLARYLSFRVGDAVGREDLMSLKGNKKRKRIFVDWVCVGEDIWLIVLDGAGKRHAERTSFTVSKIRKFVDSELSPCSFRSTLRDTPEILETLNPLISPLSGITQPGDLLILAPTSILFAIPFHALSIDGMILIERNPVVYYPSMSVLQRCQECHRKRSVTKMSIYGDPNSDRPAASAVVKEIAMLMQNSVYSGKEVIREAVLSQISEVDLLHFQGHAIHDRKDPLQSHLCLTDGKLTAAEILELLLNNLKLVVLGACESANSVVMKGDELLGIIPAFLFAGSSAVLAPLWRVHQRSAASFMKHFYQAMSSPAPGFETADAVRQAMMRVRQESKHQSPYHWAPYVLYGDWR